MGYMGARALRNHVTLGIGIVEKLGKLGPLSFRRLSYRAKEELTPASSLPMWVIDG